MTSRVLLSLCLASLALTACADGGSAGGGAASGGAGAPTSADSAPPAAVPAPGPDSAPPSPADTAPPSTVDHGPVVVFLGTSLTAGLGLARTEDTYVSRVAELADSAGLPIRAVNAGVSGATSADGLSRIGWVLRDSLDVLVLELGANDGLRGQDPRATEANLLAIIDSTRARYPDARVVLAGMQAPPNLGPDYTAAFRSVFPDVARKRHTALIPFLLEGVGGIRSLNQDDGIHPNAEGARIVAHNVWKVLEPIVRTLETHRSTPSTPSARTGS